MRKVVTGSLALAAGSFMLAGGARAQAQQIPGVVLGIDDGTEGVIMTVGNAPFGFDPTSLNIQANPEDFDLHGEYRSVLALPPGLTISVNINFLEGPGQDLSDTLNIVFTGHTPVAQDASNISVDMHFRSDSETGGLPPLVNGIPVPEVPGFMVMDGLIMAAGGPADFHLSVQSDSVPDGGSTLASLLGASALLLETFRRRAR